MGLWGAGPRLATALLSTVTVGVVVLVEGGVGWAWWLAYGVFFAALVVDGRLPGRHGVRVWLAVQVGAAVAVYLLATELAFTAVCLVTSGVAAVFVLGTRLGLAVVAGQIVVLGYGQLDGRLSDALSITAMFGGFQIFAAMMAAVALREAGTRVELEAAQSRLRSAAEADERLRISRELHDLVGHQLTVLALELEVAAHRADPAAAQHVDRARRTAKDLLSDVRKVVGRLRAGPEDVSAAFSAVARIPKPEVHLDIAEDLEFADASVAGAVIRCVQEAVTNAVRHADADHLYVTVARSAAAIVVTAADDGRGAETVTPGHGLTGMRERVTALGGTVVWETAPGQGFRLSATVPA
jgi:signal transduction histidine kinase